jgi:outer membrane protein OmpA-like peptidoglycan-associated protein
VLLATAAHAQPPAKKAVRVVDSALIATPSQLPQADSADDRPTFTLDGRMMYFGSRRFSQDPWRVADPNPNWKWDSELWYRIKTDSGWSIPINLGPPINNSNGQLNPTISPRGDELYYVVGGPVLWKAKLIDGKFQKPEPVPGMLNNIYSYRSSVQMRFMDSLRQIVWKEMLPDSDLRLRAPDAWELHFREHMVSHLKTLAALEFGTMIRCENTISPDGKYAIVSENFGKKHEYGMAGMGGDDLWIVPINEKGQWDSLLPPNGNINTAFDETYPFLAADGVTLYFTSNRPCPTCAPGTWGRQDLYRTVFDGMHWTDPEPLGPPFNSAADDYGFSIGPDGETAFFVSNRSGKSKFYQVKLHPEDSTIAPKQVVILQGRVSDAKTHKPLAAEIFVDDLTAAKNKFSVYSDSISGNYVLAAQRGHRFGIQAVAKGYLPHSERFTVPASGTFDRTQLDLELAPEEAGARTEFKNVYFNSGKTTLLKESRLELDRVVEFLKGSPKLTIEIDGHTDDVGGDRSNQVLSEARANAVLRYLADHGIPRARMTAKGFGKSKPLVQGTDDAARAANRRVEMVILADTTSQKK